MNTNKPLTSRQYADLNGSRCPICHGWDMTADHLQIEGPAAWNDVVCNDCGATWVDSYVLTGYTDLQMEVKVQPIEPGANVDVPEEDL